MNEAGIRALERARDEVKEGLENRMYGPTVSLEQAEAHLKEAGVRRDRAAATLTEAENKLLALEAAIACARSTMEQATKRDADADARPTADSDPFCPWAEPTVMKGIVGDLFVGIPRPESLSDERAIRIVDRALNVLREAERQQPTLGTSNPAKLRFEIGDLVTSRVRTDGLKYEVVGSDGGGLYRLRTAPGAFVYAGIAEDMLELSSRRAKAAAA